MQIILFYKQLYQEEDIDKPENDSDIGKTKYIISLGCDLGYQQDALDNHLSYSQMHANRDRKHPRKIIINEETGDIEYQKWPIWKTKTGSYSIFQISRKSDLEQYGEGVVAYFQFLKFLIVLFLVLAILSAPSMSFYFSGNPQKLSDFKKMLFQFSLGNLGADIDACSSGVFVTTPNQNTNTTSQVGTVYLSCDYGTMYSLRAFGQLSINDQSNCHNVLSPAKPTDQVIFYPAACDYLTWTKAEQAQLQAQFAANCFNQTNCKFEFTQSMLPSAKCTVPQSRPQNWQYLVVTDCKSQNITVGAANSTSQKTYTKEYVSVVVVLMDLAIVFTFWFSLLVVRLLEKITSDEINLGVVSASDFTVAVKQLPYKDNLLLLPGIYYSWAENILEKVDEQLIDPQTNKVDIYQNLVLDVKIGLNSYGFMSILQQMSSILQQKKIKSVQLQNRALLVKQKQKLKTQIDTLRKDAFDRLQMVHEWQQNHEATAVYAFIQFESMNGKNKFLDAMEVSCLRKFFIRRILCQDHKHQYKFLSGHWPEVIEAPDPTLIEWQNIGASSQSRFFRQVFVYILVTLLIISYYGGTIYAINYSNNLQAETQSAGCDQITVTQADAYADYLLPDGQKKNLIQCFCSSQFAADSIKIAQIQFENGEYLCSTWLGQYATTQIISFTLSISVSVVNVLLKSFIKYVSEFESHHTITDKITSTTTKMWVVQYVSSCIVIMLLNLNLTSVVSLPDKFPILTGKYKDFPSEWYTVIGTQIQITCFTNIIMPLLNMVGWWQDEFKRCMDRGCRCNERKTKQLIQQNYEQMYTGPTLSLADRYSVMIAAIFIIFTYSLSMPFLYLGGVLIFSCMYWTDKILFLRHLSTPPMFRTELAKRTYLILEWAVVLHLAFGLVMISNPDIFNLDPNKVSTTTKNLLPLTQFFGRWAKTFIGVSENRFAQTHSSLYILGICIFLCMFAIERLTGILSKVIGKVIDAIHNKSEGEEQFSTNILQEVTYEELQNEYSQAVKDLAEAETNRNDEAIKDYPTLYEYYITQLQFKIRRIKMQLANYLNTDAAGMKAQSTQKNFEEIRGGIKKKNRMNTLHSYNVLDHPTYIECKKMEHKIIKMRDDYQKALLKKQQTYINYERKNSNFQSESSVVKVEY